MYDQRVGVLAVLNVSWLRFVSVLCNAGTTSDRYISILLLVKALTFCVCKVCVIKHFSCMLVGQEYFKLVHMLGTSYK